jgi:hypothetical protein
MATPTEADRKKRIHAGDGAWVLVVNNHCNQLKNLVPPGMSKIRHWRVGMLEYWKIGFGVLQY